MNKLIPIKYPNSLVKKVLEISKLPGWLVLSLLLTGTMLSCKNIGSAEKEVSSNIEEYNFLWKTKNPILDAFMFDEEDWIAIKDPSIVKHDGKYHLFCTLRGKKRSHAIVYNSFESFETASKNKPVILPNHPGYQCAPQVFYFTPHKKWYMISQAKNEDWNPNYSAAYATTDDISDPDSWTAPKPMDVPPPPEDMYLDFWVICDKDIAYTFYTCDNGTMYRTETSINDFPQGWSDPVLAYRGDVFEASHIYKLPGQKKFVNIIEAQARADIRYFKAYLADSLDGEWYPVPSDSIGTYASAANVIQVDGVWTNGISHGELIRNGIDENMEADLNNPFIFQGVLHRNRAGKNYGNIPWRLGVLERIDDEKNIKEVTEDAPLHQFANYPVGTSIRWSMLQNDTIMDIASYEFNSLTAGNAMKMHRVLREGFVYNFDESDAYVKYAQENNMRMFGHTLLWHTSTPDFVKDLEGNSGKLKEFTKHYIDTLVSRYKGQIDAWDVVNEPVLDNDGKLRDNIWYNTFGEDYLEMVFRMAHKADPTAKLFLNDYNIERDSVKLNSFLNIVNNLKKKGVPIHGVGLQMHITMDLPNDVIEKNLKKCVESGLLIHLSELDIIFNKHDDSRGGGILVYDSLTAEMMHQQAEKYKEIAKMYNKIVPWDQRYGITFWGFADRYTWIRYFFDIMDWPLIFDDNLNKKPAYFGFRTGLREE